MRRCTQCKEERDDLYFRSRLTTAGHLSFEKKCRQCASKQSNGRHRDKRYMMTKSFERMSEEQGGLCAICKKLPGVKGLGVDHCHLTLKVRGLLCTNCNLGLGYFSENIELLRAAIAYLEGHR